MSSGSESDEEYVPGEPEKVSEEESADDETEQQYDKELEHKTKKRKAAHDVKGKKKRKTREGVTETVTEPEEQKVDSHEEQVDPVAEKKREDDLWAMFLEGTDTKAKSAPNATVTNNTPLKLDDNKDKIQTKDVKRKAEDDKAKERRIFEFAGETIVVENNVIKEKIKTADAPATVSKLEGPSPRSRGGGLSNVLGQLNKKNKLSTLEKSKLDWDTYKQDEGIEEEVKSHNKGKAGYLDRKDFLERADHRQYEIERDLRMSRRSNR